MATSYFSFLAGPLKRLLGAVILCAAAFNLHVHGQVRSGNDYIIDNGTISVRVPAVAVTGTIPPPISGIRIGTGTWLGSGSWHTALTLKSLTATVPASGSVKLRYDFNPGFGLSAPFAEITVKLQTGNNAATVEETYRMEEGAHYRFRASAGWAPSKALLRGWFRADGATAGPVSDETLRSISLLPLTRWANTLTPNKLFFMQPRWTQDVDCAWFFAASNGTSLVGVSVARAGKWIFPHDSYVQVFTDASGGMAEFHCPTWRGGRFYLLQAGPVTLADNAKSIVDSISIQSGSYSGSPRFYDSSWGNPTGGMVRGTRDRLITDIKAGNLPPNTTTTVNEVNNFLHPDFWGYPNNQWSSINPNFYSDLVAIPALKACGLTANANFTTIKQKVEKALRDHVSIAWTLPGGAGEAPGYHIYGYEQLIEIAPILKQYLGLDMATWPEMVAAKAFMDEVGRPPMGDTHPPSQFQGNLTSTKEYPGFGVVFKNGTTVMNWKAGPLRAHYHGDHLAFHWWGKAIDHQVGYCPRADQEHMHNRVTFTPSDWTTSEASMDGYERIIAFKTGASADVSMGQVESDKLRKMPKTPQEIVWQAKYPERKLTENLTYRRTMVMVKGSTTYFVVRDQHWGPDLKATFNIHTTGSSVTWNGSNTLNFGNLAIFFSSPQPLQYERFDYSFTHCSGSYTESTRGARLTTSGRTSHFISAMWPSGTPPAMSAIPNGIQVGTDEITFADPDPANASSPVVTLKRGSVTTVLLTSGDVNLNRSQGQGGLPVVEIGYPMGPMPDWLVLQRVPGYVADNPVSNLSPSATISSPASGATFTAPANITISANAADSDGTISKVDFLQGSILLGSDSTSPYSHAWSGVAAGTYSLTAKATDNAGAATTSASVSITVQNSSSSSGGTGTTVTLNPIADTYVRDGTYAGSNFAVSTTLQTKLGAAGFNRLLYLKFDTSSVSGTVSSAKLRLHGKYSSTSGASPVVAYSLADDSWTESGMTWNNQPAAGSALSSVTISSLNYAWYEWDVTGFVAGERSSGQSITSLVLKHDVTCTGNNDYYSRETVNKPQLIVTTDGGAPPPNELPSVVLTSPANGAVYTAPASVSLAANATDSDGTINKVDFLSGSTLLGADTTSPYGITWSSVGAGNYSLSARATDDAGGSAVSSVASITVNSSSSSAPSGSLTAAKAAQPAALNLSVEGTRDWSHWGLNAATDWNHRSGVTAQISNFTKIGAGVISRYTDGTMANSWTGGTPAGSTTGTKSGVYTAGVGNGFQITVPADTTLRTLRIYCGVWKSQGKLEANLSDSSAPAIVDTSHGSTTGSANTLFTIQYKAASSGQNLTVKWTVQTSHDTAGSGTVGWQSATLQ